MCVLSVRGDNYHGSLITPLHAISETTLPGHWLMNKSQITSCFFFSFTPSQWQPEDWFTDPVWWPSGELVCVCMSVHVLVCVCVCEEERRQVRSPPASSACITATPVTVSPRASCGLWACAQQSRLTVVPSGMTNYLSCLIHARNSWMRTATLIRKNFHQWKTHLWCEIWHAFGVYPILSFIDFQRTPNAVI